MMQSELGSRLAGAYTGVKHEQICAVLNSKPPAQFQLGAPVPSQQTPGQQLHKGYLTGKGVTPSSHLSSSWDYKTHRGS